MIHILAGIDELLMRSGVIRSSCEDDCPEILQLVYCRSVHTPNRLLLLIESSFLGISYTTWRMNERLNKT